MINVVMTIVIVSIHLFQTGLNLVCNVNFPFLISSLKSERFFPGLTGILRSFLKQSHLLGGGLPLCQQAETLYQQQ